MVESREERIVEVYIGEGGSEGGTWRVTDAIVDSSLSEKEACEAALNQVWDYLIKNEEIIAFTGIYCFFDDDLMEGYWDDLDDYEDMEEKHDILR
jgi:hypothetical protein